MKSIVKLLEVEVSLISPPPILSVAGSFLQVVFGFCSELKALGRSPECWLAMQDVYDLWQAKKRVKLGSVHKVHINAA